MERLLIALAIVLLAAIVGAVVRRRRRADVPTQPPSQIPSQLDRRDFASPKSPWLVVVFSSDACSTCADVIRKAEVLRSDDVVVDVASFQTRREVHERYSIDAVPCLVIADAAGEVHAGFLGPISATDLWAAVAAAREPGRFAADVSCDRHEQSPG